MKQLKYYKTTDEMTVLFKEPLEGRCYARLNHKPSALSIDQIGWWTFKLCFKLTFKELVCRKRHFIHTAVSNCYLKE